MHTQGQPESSQTRWLRLSEAAKQLNVHPTTLRRWADEGKIAFMVTPGGHRRFAESDVSQLGERRHSLRGFGPVERIWAEHALERSRRAVMARHDESWLQEHDEHDRERNRMLGHQLMVATMRYIMHDGPDDTLMTEARRVGGQYGESARDIGLPITQALQASMVFRDAMVAAAVELPDNVRIPPHSQIEMLNRINAIIDTAQLGIAEAYDGDRQTEK